MISRCLKTLKTRRNLYLLCTFYYALAKSKNYLTTFVNEPYKEQVFTGLIVFINFNFKSSLDFMRGIKKVKIYGMLRMVRGR